MSILERKQQSGFVGMVLLAISLIGAIIAAIALMARAAPSTQEHVDKTNVSILLKQSADFKGGIERMIATGISPSSITFNSNPGTGLFDTTPGSQYSVKHVPPTSILTTTPPNGATFYYNTQIRLPRIGSALPDFVIVAGPIKLSACQQINKLLYNDVFPVQTSSPSSGVWNTWAYMTMPIDDNFNPSPIYAGRPEGCVKLTDPNMYAYYKVVVEN